jgi:hypothetical protein
MVVNGFFCIFLLLIFIRLIICMFADVNWAYGCNKGLFTRHRQPKMAAFTVRDRYQKLINETQWGKYTTN